MIHRLLFALLAVALALVCGPAQAQQVVYAGAVHGGTVSGGTVSGGTVPGGYQPQDPNAAMMDPTGWHSGYYHTTWGQPVALLIPPTVTHQTNWGWGIGNTRINPIYAQYQGPMTAAASQYPYGPHRPTPYYVSDTLHFGVYYIRGPW